MNSESLKKNIGTVLFVAVLLGVLAFALWKLQGAIGQQKAVATELESEQQRLSQLQGEPIYPSPENLEIVRKNREIMQELYGGLHAAALRAIPIPKVDPIQFSILLGEKLSQLNREANRAKVGLPDRFAFSFDENLINLPPNNRVLLDTLTKHLLVIDQVSRLLFSSGSASSNTVYRLTDVNREPVTIATAEAASAQPMEQLPDGRLFRRLPFEFKFGCSTAALQHFLNSLARADWLFVVRSVSVEARSVVTNVPLEGDGEASGAPTPSRPGPAPTPGMPMMPAPMPGSGGQSATAGTRKVEHSELDVVLKLELIEFPGATAEAKPAPPP